MFIGSVGANIFSLYVLDKALFYRKQLGHIEQSFFNQGGLEENISVDFQKLTNDILGSGIDYLFINSGFCEIHTAIHTGKDVNAVIKRNMQYMNILN